MGIVDIKRAWDGKDAHGYVTAKCPLHDDRQRSLKVTEENGKELFWCYAGCRHEDIYRRAVADGLVEPPRNKKTTKKKEIVAVYPYIGEDGTPVFEVVRYEPKAFLPRRLDGTGGYVWDIVGVKKPLYRAPLVKEARESKATLFLCEGEKDVDNVVRVGLYATCNNGGAAKWEKYYTDALMGVGEVIILPDNDTAGEQHVKRIAPILQEAGINVKVLRLPGLPKKGDVSDWLQSGGSKEQLLELAAAVEEYKPGLGFAISGTELSGAQFFVKLHGAHLKHTPEKGWFVWNDKRWLASDYRAKTMATDALIKLAGHDYELAETLQTAKGMRSMLELAQAQPEIVADMNDFDNQPDLLNCLNGVLDLRSGEMRPHSPDLMCSKLIHVRYDLNAKCPDWLDFMNRVLPDPQVRSYVQRAVGYTLTGHTSEQVLFFCHGGGANGKSVFLETLQSLLCEYSCTINKKTLMMDDRKSTIPNDVARLAQMRYVAVSEVQSGEWFDESQIKDLTGGDTITARFMRKEFFDFRPQFKLWLRGNHKPDIRNMDHGIWRRIHLIPFNVTIPEEERDGFLRLKLTKELSGILTWALHGYFEWREIGLAPPPAVLEAVKEYKRENDILGSFIVERCTYVAGVSIGATPLYIAYRRWAELNGFRIMSQKKFSQSMRNQEGIEPDRDVFGRSTFVGITLIEGDN